MDFLQSTFLCVQFLDKIVIKMTKIDMLFKHLASAFYNHHVIFKVCYKCIHSNSHLEMIKHCVLSRKIVEIMAIS